MDTRLLVVFTRTQNNVASVLSVTSPYLYHQWPRVRINTVMMWRSSFHRSLTVL